jgi:hypothetical protein
MSHERVQRLQALLSRVQDNRKRTRTPTGLGLVKPAAAENAPAAARPVAAVSAVPTQAGGMAAVQPQVHERPAAAAAPARQPAPQEPARAVSPAARPAPAAQAPASPMRPAAAAPPSPPAKPQMPARTAVEAPAARAPAAEAPSARRPGQDRSATPLEMAVAELDLPSGGAPAPAPSRLDARREVPATAAPIAAAAAPAPVPMAPPIAPDEAFVIEPEPMREPARPIAQVVSRHSPQVDATFGAMLKRSLSLRPH